MSIDVRPLDGNGVILRPSGRLDAFSSPELEEAINHELEQGVKGIVVNLADVSYIASSALRVLLTTLREARRHGGDLILCCLQPRVREIFDMMGFDCVLAIYEDADTARAAVERKA